MVQKTKCWTGLFTTLSSKELLMINTVWHQVHICIAILITHKLSQPFSNYYLMQRQAIRCSTTLPRNKIKYFMPLNKIYFCPLADIQGIYPLCGFPPGGNNNICIGHVLIRNRTIIT